MALTLEKLLLLLPYDAKPDQIKTLDLSEKSIAGLPKQTAFLKALRRLSLSKNLLTDIAPVASITTLTHLDLSHNVRLTSLLPLKGLTGLVVLSVSNCGLRSLEGIEGSKNTLKSLVANDNNIILGVDAARNPANAAGLSVIADANRKALMAVSGVVETIVLSRNPNLTGGYFLPESDLGVAALSTSSKDKKDGDKKPSSSSKVDSEGKEHILEDPKNPLHLFTNFEQLRKLSLSECGIKCLPRRWYLPLLTELRLANNDLTYFSKGVLLKSVKLLDVSHNKLPHWNVLSRCKFIKQLAIKGNALEKIDTPMPTQTDRLQWEAIGREELAAKVAAAAAAPPQGPPQRGGAGGLKGKGAKDAVNGPTPAPKTPAVDPKALLASLPPPYVADPDAPSAALHDNPLEILYLRAVFPSLEILDGRRFVYPFIGCSPADIQKAISDVHKKEHLARKAAAAKKEEEQEEKKKKVSSDKQQQQSDESDDAHVDEEDEEEDEVGDDDDEDDDFDKIDKELEGKIEKVDGDDEALFNYKDSDFDAIKKRILAARNNAAASLSNSTSAPTTEVKSDKRKSEMMPKKSGTAEKEGRNIRVGFGDDEDDEVMMDESLLSRKRRREEDEERSSRPSTAAASRTSRRVEERGGDGELSNKPLARVEKASADKDTKKSAKKRSVSPDVKATKEVSSAVEDKEYEVPAAIAAKASRLAGAPNLVKRERTYAVGETAAATKASSGSDGGKKKGESRIVFSSGSDALAALRQSHSTGGGW